MRLTVRPSCLRTVRLRNPRTLCACHPVAVMSSWIVAPCSSRTRTVALLVPVRSGVVATGAVFLAARLVVTFLRYLAARGFVCFFVDIGLLALAPQLPGVDVS